MCVAASWATCHAGKNELEFLGIALQTTISRVQPANKYAIGLRPNEVWGHRRAHQKRSTPRAIAARKYRDLVWIPVTARVPAVTRIHRHFGRKVTSKRITAVGSHSSGVRRKYKRPRTNNPQIASFPI